MQWLAFQLRSVSGMDLVQLPLVWCDQDTLLLLWCADISQAACTYSWHLLQLLCMKGNGSLRDLYAQLMIPFSISAVTLFVCGWFGGWGGGVGIALALLLQQDRLE